MSSSSGMRFSHLSKPPQAYRAWKASECTARRIADQMRLDKRRQRRAAGAFVRPAVAPTVTTVDPSVVKLKGYRTLRNIFPEATHQELLQALVAAEAEPREVRAVVASRRLLTVAASAPGSAAQQRHVLASEQAFQPFMRTASVRPTPAPRCGNRPGRGRRPASAPPVVDSSCSTRARGVSARRSHRKRGPGGQTGSNEGRSQSRSPEEWVPGASDQYWAACERLRRRERPFTIRGWTPPRCRWHVDPIALKARIPTDAELHAKELAQKAAQAALAEKFRIDTGTGKAEEEAEKEEPLDLDSFDGMRDAFRREHTSSLKCDLGDQVKLVNAPVGEHVQRRFLSTVQSTGELPDYGYHGTRAQNFAGIFRQGLRIPGNGGVNVVHGSAHGVGIYTAVPGAPYLSRSFCDSPDMLVVAVVTSNEAGPRKPEVAGRKHPGRANGHRNHHRPGTVTAASGGNALKRMGRFGVKRDDKILREVGSARVIFDERYVAPMFVAKGAFNISNPQAPPPQQGQRLVSNVNHAGSDRAGAGQALIRESGERVWLPPEPIKDWNARRVKRMLKDRCLASERRKARSFKEAALGLFDAE